MKTKGIEKMNNGNVYNTYTTENIEEIISSINKHNEKQKQLSALDICINNLENNVYENLIMIRIHEHDIHNRLKSPFLLRVISGIVGAKAAGMIISIVDAKFALGILSESTSLTTVTKTVVDAALAANVTMTTATTVASTIGFVVVGIVTSMAIVSYVRRSIVKNRLNKRIMICEDNNGHHNKLIGEIEKRFNSIMTDNQRTKLLKMKSVIDNTIDKTDKLKKSTKPTLLTKAVTGICNIVKSVGRGIASIFTWKSNSVKTATA